MGDCQEGFARHQHMMSRYMSRERQQKQLEDFEKRNRCVCALYAHC